MATEQDPSANVRESWEALKAFIDGKFIGPAERRAGEESPGEALTQADLDKYKELQAAVDAATAALRAKES